MNTKISPCHAKRQLFIMVFGIFKPPETGFSRFHINFLLFLLTNRYMVTALMGADLNSILKCQKLTDEHVQFLVYQILRGLKVWTTKC